MPANTDGRDFALCVLAMLAALAFVAFVWAGVRISEIKGSPFSISAPAH
jgi:hypothetical protein